MHKSVGIFSVFVVASHRCDENSDEIERERVKIELLLLFGFENDKWDAGIANLSGKLKFGIDLLGFYIVRFMRTM